MERITLLTSVQANRLSEEIDEDLDASFEVDASLSETLRSSDKMVIKTQPL